MKWLKDNCCQFGIRTFSEAAWNGNLINMKWLKENGFKYHSLLMGKPRGGNYHWIDNHLVKATRYNGKFTDLVEKDVTIEVFDDGQHD